MDDSACRFPVTAYSLCNALGGSTSEVIEALAEGRSGLAPPPFELPFETHVGAMTTPLPRPPTPLDPYDTRLFRMSLLGLEGVIPRLERAVEIYGSDRVAIVLGTSTGGIEDTERAYHAFARGDGIPSSFDFELHHPFHAVAEAIAWYMGIRGPCYVISTACSSGGKTLAAGRRLLLTGAVDAVLTGSVDGLSQTTLRGFHSLSILSPSGCRPFSSERQGISIGEGAGFLLLERQGESATSLLGVGESSDAYHMSSPEPQGLGAEAAMRAALGQAGLEPEDVDHINTHGTGTKRNDEAESLALERVFGREVPAVSTKGYTGHLLGAGGSTEAIFALIAIEQGWIPASLGSDPLDEAITIDVALERRAHPSRVVLSNSFGFGGSNVSVLLGASS